jgi:hypothetical protein
MKQIYMLLTLALVVLTSMSAVSALTIVTGTVYGDEARTILVDGATVNAVCNNATSDTTISESSGQYTVTFAGNVCPNASTVLVTATKDGLTGSDTGTVGHIGQPCVCATGAQCSCGIDIAFACPVLIPEFGLVIGSLTALSAIALFFFVRRK